MRTAIITKIFRFESAHRLEYHQGKCAQLHGHSYKLEVSVFSNIKEALGQSDHGMVMDFSELSHIVKEAVIAQLDHKELGEATGVYSTAEHLIHWIWEQLIIAGIPKEVLYRLRLWETESSYAELSQDIL
ncbi:MAG: 6-carboxytetrahydropterin synthase [Chloroflexi bacterium]|uniref:6-carboxy-5,6,7,8-tetrahydropterin synthase n=1 Tax=Candidatus Chlorohelix allophototropha TaxID=3003348 RepID=A0A8T7LYE6_9CHLR|nr:6-carboxytetrahydropterin synthase [Chloroflexota bacterium]WJW67205.1 6-carboxytetrahydropterin synthase [Chloroflexota bacterium L227-S17]